MVSRLSEEDPGGRSVVVDIRDSGRGFSPEQLERMWEMFQQSRNGIGFGLWWIRTFIERQGGTIDCASSPGAGAVFTLRLPVHAPKGVSVSSVRKRDR